MDWNSNPATHFPEADFWPASSGVVLVHNFRVARDSGRIPRCADGRSANRFTSTCARILPCHVHQHSVPSLHLPFPHTTLRPLIGIEPADLEQPFLGRRIPTARDIRPERSSMMSRFFASALLLLLVC